MAEVVIHNFVSAKTQSPDTTLVSKNEWNDGHAFSGGINGQVLLYDNTQPNNMRWTDGAKTFSDLVSVTNPTASPMNSKASVSFTSSSPIILTITASYLGITTTGAANITATLIINGGTAAVDTFASGITYVTQRISSAAAGAQEVHINFTSAGSVNFTGGLIYLTVIAIGV